jgi:hypothetical protein
MRTKVILFGLLIASAVFSPAIPQALGQEQEEDVRGAFLTTRPKTTDKVAASPTPRPVRRHSKTTTTKPANPAVVGTTTIYKTNEGGPAKAGAQLIGLGLTLFSRDSNGLAVRIDPTHEFRKGDRVRLLLETNTDGYLYIFNTTDGGQPVMIYPDPVLGAASNFIHAHVPVELPSSVATEERLRWLTFDEHPGIERLFLAFTREPLSAVPIEDDLINYCREKSSNCPMRVPAGLWVQVQEELKVPVQTAKTQRFGNAQTASEHQATTRGIGLSKEDPEPSLIMMRASSSTGLLVVMLELLHK